MLAKIFQFIGFAGLYLLSFQQASAQYNFTFRDQINYTQNANDVWAYVSASGTEYALVGTQTGISIVDVSNPDDITEVQFIADVNNTWRDIDIWQNYAYVTTESATAGGLLVINLSNLPASAPSFYTQLGFGFTTAHTIWIDENGIAYLFGANSSGTGSLGSGTFMVDVAANATNPVYLGKYSGTYVHDGFVRNDTLWSAEIFAGHFRAVDVSNKSAPVIMATQTTPNAFTHNAWPTDDGNYLFTTDEQDNSFVTAYNVSDLSNIFEIDRYQHEPGSNAVPHNVYVRNNFLIVAYYTAGVTIVDATYPYNLIEVAHYDTSPFTGGGFSGVWAAYAWLPSGNMLVSDRQEGLFVLTPNYVQACYLEGIVSNAITGMPIANASVSINGLDALSNYTDFSGHYATGAAATGTYSVVVSAPGFFTDTVSVALNSQGLISYLNIALTPSGVCAIPPSNIQVTNITSNAATISWSATPDANAYTVYYRLQGISTWTSANSASNSLDLSGLNSNTNYEVYVQADCGGGYLSAVSNTYLFTTLPTCPIPTGLSASSLNPNTAKLQWSLLLNVVGYTVQYRQQGSTSWTQVSTSLNSITISGLLACTNYEFRVAGNCGSGSLSAFSEIYVFSTATPAFTLANTSLAVCAPTINLNTLLIGASGGVWSGGAYVSGSSFNPSGLAIGQYAVTYTVSGTNCSVSETTQITITPAPSPAFNPTTIETCNNALDLNTLVTGTTGGIWSGGTYVVSGFFVPAALEPGTYPVTYTVGSGACQSSLTQTLEVVYCPLSAQIKVYLEGAFVNPDSMRTQLALSGLLPLAQPYNQAPWQYNGAESVTEFPEGVVDWVLVELRSTANNAVLVAQKAALLLKNGSIADVSGVNGVLFYNLPPNSSYYLVVRHRNHLAVMSAVPVTLPNNTPYNFSISAAQALGSNQQKAVAPGVFALKAGDFDANGVIAVADFNLFFEQAAATGQYNPADAQLNGSVSVSDFNLYRVNGSALSIGQLRY